MGREEYPNAVLSSIVRKDYLLRSHRRREDIWHWADRLLMERGAWDFIPNA